MKYVHGISCSFYSHCPQDAVDILDSLLDPKNDMSFQEISSQVRTCSTGCCVLIRYLYLVMRVSMYVRSYALTMVIDF